VGVFVRRRCKVSWFEGRHDDVITMTVSGVVSVGGGTQLKPAILLRRSEADHAQDWEIRRRRDPRKKTAVNTYRGNVVYAAVAESQGKEWRDVGSLMLRSRIN
jgi:hypothetical protein